MDRRHLLLGAALAPVAVMTDSPRLAGIEQLDELNTELRALAASWETTTPADSAMLAWDLHHRGQVLGAGVRGRAAGDWAAVAARAGLLHGQALTDLGKLDAASRAAVGAQIAAHRAGDTHTGAMAAILAAHITGKATPGSGIALATMRAASRQADGAWVAAFAAVEEANLLAARGAHGWQVLDAVRSAERCALGDGLAFGYPLTGWSRGYVSSFGGAALVAAGEHVEAGPRLRDAAAWSGPDAEGDVAAAGIHAMTLVYLARLAVRTSDADGAEELCGRALDVDPERPMVPRGVLSIAAEARARHGARWDVLRGRARGLIAA